MPANTAATAFTRPSINNPGAEVSPASRLSYRKEPARVYPAAITTPQFTRKSCNTTTTTIHIRTSLLCLKIKPIISLSIFFIKPNSTEYKVDNQLYSRTQKKAKKYYTFIFIQFALLHICDIILFLFNLHLTCKKIYFRHKNIS